MARKPTKAKGAHAPGTAGGNAAAPAGRAQAGAVLGLPYRLGTACLTLLQVFGLLALIVVAGCAVFAFGWYNWLEGQSYSEHLDLITVFTEGCYSHAAALIVCAALLFGLAFAAWRSRICRVPSRRMLFAVELWAFVFQLLWAASLQTGYFIFPDTTSLAAAAESLLAGDLASFMPSGDIETMQPNAKYFTMYPFQAGSMYLFAVVFKLFGTGNYLAFQVVNALANCVAIAALLWLARSMGASRRAKNLFLLLTATCLPLLFSCSFVYGNAVGFCFSCLALALLAHAFTCGSRGATLAFTAASFVAIAIAIMAKNTCTLFLIAMVLVALVQAVRIKAVSLGALALVCAVCASQLGGLPLAALEAQTGADFGDGMPKASWIAMGLRQDNPLDMPGSWSLVPYSYLVETEGDGAAQQELAIESIESSLSGFAASPQSALRFFAVKVASEWADPTFQTLYYSSLCVNDDSQGAGSIRDYGRFASTVLYGTANTPVLWFIEAHDALVAVGALAFAIGCVRRGRSRGGKRASGATASFGTKPARALMLLAVAVGFAVYVLWEAKSVYLLPFFLLMLPMAAIGLDAACKALDERLTRR